MILKILVNKTSEEQRALVDVYNDKVIMSGDWYHDKIDERIEGYLQALKDHNIYNEEAVPVDTEEIGPKNPYFSECDFIDERWEDEDDE